MIESTCHCGAVKLEIQVAPVEVTECNCSICGRLGALRWFVPRSAVRFTTPENNLSTYQFGKHKIKHHFCSTCGCAPLGGGTHNGIEMASINVRCLEGVELSALKIKQVDGRSF